MTHSKDNVPQTKHSLSFPQHINTSTTNNGCNNFAECPPSRSLPLNTHQSRLPCCRAAVNSWLKRLVTGVGSQRMQNAEPTDLGCPFRPLAAPPDPCPTRKHLTPSPLGSAQRVCAYGPFIVKLRPACQRDASTALARRDHAVRTGTIAPRCYMPAQRGQRLAHAPQSK